MYKILLISLVTLIKICYSLSAGLKTHTPLILPTGERRPDELTAERKSNELTAERKSNELTDISSKTVTLNGRDNNYATQQIFYIYEQQQWRVANNDTKERDDYSSTPGLGSHKLHLRKITWNEARGICINEGGHLAVINSNLEESILIQMLIKNNINAAWVGVHDLFREGDWVSVLDEPLEATGYSRWTTKYANEPDNFNGNQNCGTLVKEGGMDDLACDNREGFFCEISNTSA